MLEQMNHDSDTNGQRSLKSVCESVQQSHDLETIVEGDLDNEMDEPMEVPDTLPYRRP